MSVQGLRVGVHATPAHMEIIWCTACRLELLLYIVLIDFVIFLSPIVCKACPLLFYMATVNWGRSDDFVSGTKACASSRRVSSPLSTELITSSTAGFYLACCHIRLRLSGFCWIVTKRSTWRPTDSWVLPWAHMPVDEYRCKAFWRVDPQVSALSLARMCRLRILGKLYAKSQLFYFNQ